jgi:hypothetical protein
MYLRVLEASNRAGSIFAASGLVLLQFQRSTVAECGTTPWPGTMHTVWLLQLPTVVCAVVSVGRPGVLSARGLTWRRPTDCAAVSRSERARRAKAASRGLMEHVVNFDSYCHHRHSLATGLSSWLACR